MIENYRSISVIPAASKVIKNLVHLQLSTYLEDDNLLNENQFGFRKGRSTELAATLFTDTIKRKVDEGKLVGCVFIELTKAFDTINHGALLNKLESYRITLVSRFRYHIKFSIRNVFQRLEELHLVTTQNHYTD